MTSLRDYEWQISYGPADDRLRDFYIPALQRSVHYDRSAGFFSSSALAVAAAGVAGLIANGGTMRLLVGAQLSREDVEAIARGASMEQMVAEQFTFVLDQPTDELLRHRLEILAWMVAQGTLQIKVVLPRSEDGLPVAGEQAVPYFHTKEGLFTDTEGNQLAFSGSINESMTAWQHNYEQFTVYFSWETTRPYLAQVAHRFNNAWDGREPGWIAFDIPQAARDSLLRYVPSRAPEYDPLAPETVEVTIEPSPDEETALRHERIIFQFLRDAPYMLGAETLGQDTCAINPWPHQVNVSRRIISTYPKRYMLCDEVGLGKTIEAGLVLRQLVISGRVKRCLLLVPKSVARQWQEELYEKFVLDVPLYEAGTFRNYAGDELEWQYDTDNPWNAFDLMIASSQLAKRKERRAEVTAADPWDLVLVDEAHHARRRDFLQPSFRPNRLLGLLTDPNFQATSILLMTATPMQVHPLEVWDLLNILGLGGKWGADGEYFLAFYRELTKSFDDADWNFVFEMVRDHLAYGGSIDGEFRDRLSRLVGMVDAQAVLALPSDPKPARAIQRLPSRLREYASEMARRHTPLHDRMFRNTRDLLREYAQRGLLDASVPERDPQLVWIPMTAEEMALYHRIDEYISNFYRKYENERKGLGFVMTVYRRRLTSSFYAVRRSLERRLEFLEGRSEQSFDDDDLEQEDLAADITEALEDDPETLYRDEITYVRSFISDLQQLSTHDSKTERLLEDLDSVFRQRETAIVFTQYTDTMDYLREKLRLVYGTQVACFSGRGGELWNGIAWVSMTKEEIKQAFREGDKIKILVCTEAASEGLNLQTCGVLFNYDMPWNPMRVEQRIGRIDRIGQIHAVVWIRNYFYEETVEAQVYRALEKRINWFEGVVGELQPILARVGRAIERLVMAVPDERDTLLKEEVSEIEHSLDVHEGDMLGVYQETESVSGPPATAACVTLTEIEQQILHARQLPFILRPHPEIEHGYLLSMPQTGEKVVTFDPSTFDQYPNSVTLLSYGNWVLAEILRGVPQPNNSEQCGILKLEANDELPLVAYYRLDAEGNPIQLRSFTDLTGALMQHSATTANWPREAYKVARADFEHRIRVIRGNSAEVWRQHAAGRRSTLIEQAIPLLQRAALAELSEWEQADNFTIRDEVIHLEGRLLLRLRQRAYPVSALLQIANNRIQEIQCPAKSRPAPGQIQREWDDLKRDAQKLLARWGKLASSDSQLAGEYVVRHSYVN